MNSREPSSPVASRQRGSIVVYLAVTLAAFGILAMAGGTRYGASILGVSAPNCATQARLMAESGVRYASARLRSAADQAALTALIAALNGQTYTVSGNMSFTLAVQASGPGAALVTSTGRACGGVVFSPATTNQAQTSVNVPAAGGGGGGEITQGDLLDSSNIIDLTGQPAIVKDAAGNTIFLGIIGQTENSAALWYAGNSTSCVEGACNMPYGLRAYFEVQWDISSTADGIVFGLMSALTNTSTALGGDTAMGELMGWGGRGPTAGVDGIRPPKIGLELDTWRNNANTPVYNSDSRADKNSTGLGDRNSDHLSYVFWGSNTSETFRRGGWGSPWITSTTYDDNRHASDSSGSAGTGSSSDPISYLPISGSGDGRWGYYYTLPGNWLKNGTKYKIRFELTRHKDLPNAAGNYPYILKTWVKSGAVSSSYQNVNQNYTADAPNMYRAVFLSSALHTQLAKIFFGFTEATGGATQKVALTGFNLSFKSAAETPAMPGGYASYWPLNDNSGTGVDDANATSNNDGTLSGGASQWYNPGGCPRCPAVRLNGANNSHIHVPDANTLDLTTQGSISAWFTLLDYVDATHNAAGLVHKGDNTATFADEAYSLQFLGARVLCLYVNSGSGDVMVVTPQIPKDNNWHHVVGTWDATELLIYVDGVLQGRTANTSARAARNSAGGLNIGSQGHGSVNNYPFMGPLSRVALYNRVLTAAEIAEMAVGQY
ncbi:MAG: LamG domain-containing protein [Proteobacteria bacterium]|nr:LamG domain-containing protein [Pseudomonadota bacterium]MBU1595919.1 LamG domain-containing protein [Pseudomonadota bacterium]